MMFKAKSLSIHMLAGMRPSSTAAMPRTYTFSPSRLFASSSDTFPVGSKVQLDSGEHGVIIEGGKRGWYKVGVPDSTSGDLQIASFRKASLKAFASESMQNIVDVPMRLAESPVSVFTPPACHAAKKKWILFSDLHVKSSSIDICEQVLEQVHTEAEVRNAGVMFLGDFWHVRGALSVDLLNRILRSLRRWTCPVIMIPGNHDQVNLGGSVHSLEPLQYAFAKDQAVIFSEPVICMGALWVPYRRDHELLKVIISPSICY